MFSFDDQVLFNRSAFFMVSTDSTANRLGTLSSSFTLLDCKDPMKCHRMSEGSLFDKILDLNNWGVPRQLYRPALGRTIISVNKMTWARRSLVHFPQSAYGLHHRLLEYLHSVSFWRQPRVGSFGSIERLSGRYYLSHISTASFSSWRYSRSNLI